MRIALLGCGVVGSGVRKILDKKATEWTQKIDIKTILVKTPDEIDDPRRTTSFSDILEDPEIELVAEMMGGLEPAHSFVRDALLKGKHVVTSNKKMLATFYPELSSIAREKGVSLCFEATAGGGIPWIANLGRITRVEPIQHFSGIMNGTTNYILSRMTAEHCGFTELLSEAQRLGYAEADPTDDIDGFDVRYKCCISAIKAFGLYVSPENIPVFGIRNILKEDIDFCRKNNLVCKLIGRGDLTMSNHLALSVSPAFVPANSLLANIDLNYNAVQTDSPNLGPATFVGQGAGSLPTAHAVVQDILDIAAHDVSQIPACVTVDPTFDDIHRFYIRSANADAFRAHTNRFLSSTVCICDGMTFTSLEDAVRQANDPNLFIAEICQ